MYKKRSLSLPSCRDQTEFRDAYPGPVRGCRNLGENYIGGAAVDCYNRRRQGFRGPDLNHVRCLIATARPPRPRVESHRQARFAHTLASFSVVGGTHRQKRCPPAANDQRTYQQLHSATAQVYLIDDAYHVYHPAEKRSQKRVRQKTVRCASTQTDQPSADRSKVRDKVKPIERYPKQRKPSGDCRSERAAAKPDKVPGEIVLENDLFPSDIVGNNYQRVRFNSSRPPIRLIPSKLSTISEKSEHDSLDLSVSPSKHLLQGNLIQLNPMFDGVTEVFRV